MGQWELHKALIYQALEDLYSKRRKNKAEAWLFGKHQPPDMPPVTCQESCDMTMTDIDDIHRIAGGILAGMLPKKEFNDLIERF